MITFGVGGIMNHYEGVGSRMFIYQSSNENSFNSFAWKKPFDGLSINWYLEKMIDLLEMSPNENQFQDFLVYPILEHIIHSREICEVDLIDCHNFRQNNTKLHDRRKYSVLVKAVPDLLIAKDFFYNNRDKKVFDALELVASIEVKEPNSKSMLGSEYSDELFIELLPSLIKNKKVILTNIRRWETFDINKVKNEDLLKKVREYVNVLELCGFDSVLDYETIAINEDGKNKTKKQLKPQVVNERWEQLKSILQKEDIISSIESIDSRAFKSIVEGADKKYLSEIKEFVKQSHVTSWDIISKSGLLEVNRFDSDSKALNEISSITDISYDEDAYNKLFEGLYGFLFA